MIIVNYSVRLPKVAVQEISATRPQMDCCGAGGTVGIWPVSYKLEEAGKLGIAADHTEPLLNQSRFSLWDNNHAPADFDEAYSKVGPRLAMNHDNAWNVLFTDGSVKTYNDGARNIKRFMATWWNSNGYNMYEEAAYKRTSIAWEDRQIWTPYFDTAYEQD